MTAHGRTSIFVGVGGRVLRAIAWVVTGLLVLVVVMRFAWHDGLWPFLLANTLTPYLFAPVWPIAIGRCSRAGGGWPSLRRSWWRSTPT